MWSDFIASEMKQPYFKTLSSFLKQEEKSGNIFPDKKNIFKAFELCEINNIKSVILAQDPYHGINQAHGLAFSVNYGIPAPPSLKNIFKELATDLNIDPPNHGCLETWAKQGVLLLNSILTVRQGLPGSHKDMGWETFTDNAIKLVNDLERPIVFILWGAFARSKKSLISGKQHLVLENCHPSPLSAYNGFFGSRPFSKTNEFLVKNGIGPIDWKIV